MLNEGIQVQAAPRCVLCAAEGEVVYRDLRDNLFEAPGVWSIRKCARCGLFWLDPRPTAADIGKLYAGYYTHTDVPAKLASLRGRTKSGVLAAAFGYRELRNGWIGSIVGHLLAAVRPVRDRVGAGIAYLDGRSRGRLLDVGCGSGLYLSRMRQLGWQVDGVDPDPQAVKNARERYNIPVQVGDMSSAGFPEAQFDAVTLNHVIEHAVDPVALLRSCGRVLKPTGQVVIITPNVQGLGHRQQQVNWRGLEPPRHLFLFSPSTLATCVEKAGLYAGAVRTSARAAANIWTAGWQLRHNGRAAADIDTSLRFHPWSLLFQCREEIACSLGWAVGEELVMTARRQ